MKSIAWLFCSYLILNVSSCVPSVPDLSPDLKQAQDSLVQLHQQLDSLKQLTDERLRAIKLSSQAELEKDQFLKTYVGEHPMHWYKASGVAVAEAPIYNSTDSSQNIIGRYPYNRHLSFDGGNREYHRIKLGEEKYGYISREDAYEFKVSDYKSRIDYVVSSVWADNNWHSELIIRVYDTQKRPAQLLTEKRIPNQLHGYRAGLAASALQNAEKLLRIQFHRNACPGMELDLFFYYHKGQLHQLVQGSSTGEMGEYDFTNYYLPVTFSNGNTLHLKNADRVMAFNQISGEVMDQYVPSYLDSIPKEEIIIRQRKSAEAILDENQRYKYDENGETRVQITVDSLAYFRWNGHQLTPIPLRE